MLRVECEDVAISFFLPARDCSKVQILDADTEGWRLHESNCEDGKDSCAYIDVEEDRDINWTVVDWTGH